MNASLNLAEIMKRLDVTPGELARETGISASVIRNAWKGEEPSSRTKFAIEAAFDQPIWSDQKSFEARRRLRKYLGKDPVFMSLCELKVIARDLGVRYGQPRDALTIALSDAVEKRASIPLKLPSQEELDRSRQQLDTAIEANGWRCLHCKCTFRSKATPERLYPNRCPQCRSTRILPNVAPAVSPRSTEEVQPEAPQSSHEASSPSVPSEPTCPSNPIGSDSSNS